MPTAPKYPRLLATRPYLGRTQVLSIFRAFADADGAVLLDSATHADGRFDLAAALPHARLQTSGADSHLRFRNAGAATTASHSGRDPFQLLRELWQSQRQAPAACDLLPPFCGGLIAAFAYDLGRRIETLAQQAEADIALPELIAGIYHWAVIVDHERQHCGLWQFGALDDKDLAQAQQWFSSASTAAPAPFHLSADWQPNMSRDAYASAFRQVQRYIAAGDCYQINLAQRFSAAYSGSPWSAYEALSAQNGAPFSAFLQHEQGALLSFSPERFMRVENGLARTEPIKGTRPRGKTAAEDIALQNELRSSEKDRAENVMIVDLLRNDFGRNCATGSVKVPELFALHSYPAVHHLISTVTGELAAGRDALDLLRGAFPGGSITGAPKIRAMQIIEELEPQRRSYYCGSIAYYDYAMRFDSSIAIRTLICHQDRMHAYAGGGIVADSEEQSEYDETLHKLAKLLPLISAL